MFTPPNNNNNQANNPGEQDNEQPNFSFEETAVPESEIHTMPDKFLQPAVLSPLKRGRVNWIILGVVIFLALGGIIVTVVLFLGRQAQPVVLPPADQTPLTNNNQATTTADLNLNNNQNQNLNINLDSVAGRDVRRLTNLSSLHTALALYFTTYQIFPSSLSNLLSEFLSELPLNPGLTAPTPYNYQPAEDQQGYKISFSLEDGGNWGIVKLPQGDYYLTPQGIVPQTSANLNGNDNTNSNNSTTTGDALPQTPPIVPATPGKGLDSDGDQLTDIEENLYQTNSNLADTDNDGYTDAAEILSHYDPLKPLARLIDSGLIKIYQNPNYYYSLFYPAGWSYRAINSNNSELIFTATTGEFVKISIQPNPLSLSAANWYLAQNKTQDLNTLKRLTVAGFPAVQTPDGLITYLAFGSDIYIIAYDIGNQQQMNFYTTYQLFLKSFIFINSQY